MTYAGETWDPNKKEMEDINRLMDKIIKRILMTPPTTPREALYMETGLLDNEYTIAKNRVNMQIRLNSTQNELIKMARNSGNKDGWEEKTEAIRKKLKIKRTDITGTKERTKTKVKERQEMLTEFHLANWVGNFSSSCSLMAALPRNKSIWVPGGSSP